MDYDNNYDDGTGGMGGFSSLTPEAMQQLLSLGTLNKKDDLLQKQLSQAQALRGKGPTPSYGAFGAITNGIGDIINAAVNKHERDKLMDMLSSNYQSQDTARGQLLKAMFGQQQQPSTDQDVLPAQPMTDDGGY